MIKVQFMKPFYTKLENNGETLRLVFAYQYFSVVKDEKVYQFIPIEGKEMKIDLNKEQITNLSEVFVFQNGNKFLRLPLYQLALVSNLYDFLTPILKQCKDNLGAKVKYENKNNKGTKVYSEKKGKDVLAISNTISEEAESIVFEIETQNILHAIDLSLEDGDEETFKKLTAMLNNRLTKA